MPISPATKAKRELVKICKQCDESKPLSCFRIDMRSVDGRRHKCVDCMRTAKVLYYQNNPEKDAQRRATTAECSRRWYVHNKDRIKGKMRAYRLLRLYGVTEEQYDCMFAAQDGKCVICGTTKPRKGNNYFVVDHDHQTGKVRGLLCHRCNAGLEFFSDNSEHMREAANYVERHRK